MFHVWYGLEIDFEFTAVGASERVEHTVGIAPCAHFAKVGLSLGYVVVVSQVVDITVDGCVKLTKLE